MHSFVSAFFSFVQWALSIVWICAVIYGIARLGVYLFKSGGAGRPIGSVIMLALTGGLLLHWAGADRWALPRLIDTAIGFVLLCAMGVGALVLLADSFGLKQIRKAEP
ncbi:MAG TPA: hypothetical protein VFL13_16280 [Candidatus Baltobacteraceae bacterium]|nr:hypothetical protein [Candidatus Baltobacteraceae bacterium]